MVMTLGNMTPVSFS